MNIIYCVCVIIAVIDGMKLERGCDISSKAHRMVGCSKVLQYCNFNANGNVEVFILLVCNKRLLILLGCKVALSHECMSLSLRRWLLFLYFILAQLQAGRVK